jgi:putative salt-induced outer membrane protein
MNRFLPPLVLLALATPVSADWTPTAELGLVNTSGNSDTASANGKFALKGEDALWTHEYFLAALRAESDDALTANRLELGARTARRLGERQYLGFAARYERDDFSAFEQQSTLALNYGTWLLKEEGRSFQLEGGPGLRHARRAEDGGSETDALLRGYADYQHQITDSTQFFNTLLVEATADNTFAQNDIGIAVSINKTLALKAAFQARHNTEAPVGLARTDTLTSVNIVWSPRAKAP